MSWEVVLTPLEPETSCPEAMTVLTGSPMVHPVVQLKSPQETSSVWALAKPRPMARKMSTQENHVMR
jgi:hypothetical protein